MRISLNQSNRPAANITILESDTYRMQIKRATIELDTYAEPRKDGSQPEKLVLCWEVTAASDEQDESVIGASVWQRMAPYYGDVREGGPSRFKEFIDSLVAQGLIELDIEAGLDPEDLVGIEQRVTVEKRVKTMGANKGQYGNRVAAVLPLKARRKATAPATPAKPIRNAPQSVAGTTGLEDDDSF